MYKHYFLNEETMVARVLQSDKRVVWLTGTAKDAVRRGDVVYSTEGGERAIGMYCDGSHAVYRDHSYRPLLVDCEVLTDALVESIKRTDRQVAISLTGDAELPEELVKYAEVIDDLNKLSREEI